MKRVGSLEIDQDLGLERVEARIQRLAWCVMLLVLVAAVLGLFGSGLLDSHEVRAEGIAVRYSRFERMNSPAKLEVRVPPAAPGGSFRIWLAREYVRHFDIQTITPAPQSSVSTGERLVYTFQAGPGPATVRFEIQVAEGTTGPIRATLGAEPGGTVSFTQFIWP